MFLGALPGLFMYLPRSDTQGQNKAKGWLLAGGGVAGAGGCIHTGVGKARLPLGVGWSRTEGKMLNLLGLPCFNMELQGASEF